MFKLLDRLIGPAYTVKGFIMFMEIKFYRTTLKSEELLQKFCRTNLDSQKFHESSAELLQKYCRSSTELQK